MLEICETRVLSGIVFSGFLEMQEHPPGTRLLNQDVGIDALRIVLVNWTVTWVSPSQIGEKGRFLNCKFLLIWGKRGEETDRALSFTSDHKLLI